MFKISKKVLLSSVIVLTVFSVLLSPSLLAAELYFEPQAKNVSLNQTFKVTLMLDTNNEAINAISGIIEFNNDLVALSEIRDGGSIINLWLDKPALECGQTCQLNFSGIIPGGFIGTLSAYQQDYQPGEVLELVFKSKNLGQGTINLKDIQLLLNDGLGTQTDISLKPVSFKVLETDQGPGYVLPLDTIPPEPFEAVITKNPQIFDNKYFIIFQTQDKDSGIDYYQVREGEESFQAAESPYLLKYQFLNKRVVIKAVDKAGNERTVFVEPLNQLVFINFTILAIILAVSLSIILIWIKLKEE